MFQIKFLDIFGNSGAESIPKTLEKNRLGHPQATP